MDVKEIDVLGEDIDRHWYYRTKANLMTRALDGVAVSRVLDVGAGSGFFSRHVLETTAAREALCVDPNYAEEHDETVNGKPLAFRRTAVDFDADLILMMDVLEHVDDDVGLLQGYSAANPRALVLITVPAFEFLWSGHDVFLDHKRRYTLDTLAPVVRSAGLDVVWAGYGFAPVLPIAAALRLLDNALGKGDAPQSQLKRHHPLVNAALYGLCALERPLFRANRLGGLSAFCLAKRG
ncbi:MAG: methyltransferase domain-containing protein [Arenibacter algicola]|nr:methyltransferase domain-containing protein [Arenibacter algicola]